MPTDPSKSKSILKLREFCSSPPHGMISNWWFHGLRTAYPLHFLYFSQFSTIFTETKKKAREKIVTKFEHRIKKLLDHPVTEREIEIIERMWAELDELIDLSKKMKNN